MYNGLLLIDKTAGGTSHDVVDDVRRILKQKAVGHTGTLDPMASGLMVLLLGQATKLSDYILAQDKRYRVQIWLGKTSRSGDTMEPFETDVAVDANQLPVAEVLNQMCGDFELAVPIFSAVKVKGQKLYDLARADRPVEAPLKAMSFYALKVHSIHGDRIDVEISCSKGAYIRSWVMEIGRRLGCGAVMCGLRRLNSQPYHVDTAISVEQLRNAMAAGALLQSLAPAYIPMKSALPDWYTCSVKGREEQLLKNGQISYDLSNRLVVAQKEAHLRQKAVGVKVLGASGDLLGLLEAKPQSGLKIRRIFGA